MTNDIQKKNGTSQRFALIEAVRGLAAFLVVFSHTMPKDGWFYDAVFDPGKIGVVVFFFLSGFLVIPSAASDGSAKRFLIKRLFRLYPLYWVSLLFAFVVWRSELELADWIANITMAQQFLGFENAIDVYWTLTIEVALYSIITACLLFRPALLTDHFRTVLWALGAVCILMAIARWGLQAKLPVALPLGLLCMFSGAQMRFLSNQGKSILPPIKTYLIVAIPTCWIAYSFSISFGETSSRYIVTYIVGMLIFVVILKRPQLDLGKHVRALGDWSYGIYLFHMIIIYLISPWFEKGVILFILVMLLSILISAPLFHLVERPAVKIGHRLLGARSR
ncbi:acyltransferase [Pacificibacter marinus]|nr:acyltransferase [Pacificibacter marinus]